MAACTVKVAVPLPATLVGLMEQVVEPRVDETTQVSATFPVNPLEGVTVRVSVPELPLVSVRLLVAALTTKLGAVEEMVTLSGTLCVRLPLVPVTVTAPVAAALPAVMVTVAVPLVVTLVGLMVQEVDPKAEATLHVNATVPVKPLTGATVNTSVTVLPGSTDRLELAGVRVNVGIAVPLQAATIAPPSIEPRPLARS